MRNDMLIEVTGIKFYIERYNRQNISKNSPIILLHGFTGSGRDWDLLIPRIAPEFKVYTIDLIGHGKSGSPPLISYYETNSIVNQLKIIISKLTSNKIILIGYSMGGRAALSFAVKYPELVGGLIIESASAGIDDINLRNKRINADNLLAGFIESQPMEKFVDYWMSRELFKTQKYLSEDKLNSLRANKLKNNPVGLANILRGFSTGKMPQLMDKLSLIKSKAFLITGELDTKFTSINHELVSKFPSAEHKIIKNAGHNTHLEKPQEFINMINFFLNKFLFP